MRFTSIALLGLFLMAESSLGESPGKSDGKLVAGNNQFAFDLYGQLRDEQGNLFFSPFSITTALGMTYAGARGETADQMQQVLHYPDGPQQIGGSFATLVQGIQAEARRKEYKLNIANRLWGQEGFPFNPQYTRAVERDFRSGLQQLDFKRSTEKARQTINAWVEKETQEKIKELLKPGDIRGDTRLVLTNAIYLEANWINEFNAKSTQEGPFKVSAEREVKVPLMHLIRDRSYAETEQLQLVEIPYRGGLSMVVILPRKVDGLAEVEKGLTAGSVDELLKKAKPYEVDLYLPKFSFRQHVGLGRTLQKMGMRVPFLPQADFSGMLSNPEDKLQISDVIHEAYVQVDEKGTIAAAATAVVMRLGAAMPQKKQRVLFRADHPFVFLLRDQVSGSVLFMGRVVNPAS